MKNITNIVSRCTDKNINILYSISHRLFDNIVSDIEDFNLYIENDIAKSYYYDFYWSNNFLSHINNTIHFCKKNHLIDVLSFHSEPPAGFKKEDIMLTNSNTKNSHKIIFGKEIASAWGFTSSSKTHIVEYGIPETEWSLNGKTKNVLVLNLENNPQIDLLYSNVRSEIPNTDILKSTNCNTSIKTLIHYLSQYKVVIDFGNKINVLLCASVGNKCITPLNIENDLVFRLDNFTNIIPATKQILELDIPEETIYNTSRQIISKYDYQIFSNKLLSIFSHIKDKEIFTI